MLEQFLEKIRQLVYHQLVEQFPGSDIVVQNIVLEQPPQPDMGDFAIACFPFARQARKSPVQIAAILEQNFPPHDEIEKVKANGPYLNIKIIPKVFHEVVCQSVLKQSENFGHNDLGSGKCVMIEYSSPNTNKPLHIGHVRNNLIGMALANIFEFCGYRVIKANLINDRGIHICKSMLAYQKWGKGTDPVQSKLKGDHLVGQFYVAFEKAIKEERTQYAQDKGIDLETFSKDQLKQLKQKIKETKDKEIKKALKIQLKELNQRSESFEQEFLAHSVYYQEALQMLGKWEKNDPEVRALWQKMNDWVMEGFAETYRALSCEFDKIYKESDTYHLGKEYVQKGLKDGLFFQKEEGSIWVSAESLKKISPKSFKGFPLKDKLLLRADGTSVYMTQDIGTAILKAKDFQLDQSIYVVASEQLLHFKILFSILDMMGFSWAKGCYHAAYGMVTLPEGMGKIKSREGTAVDADDLLKEMGERARQKIINQNLRVPKDSIEKTSMDIALAALKIFVLQVSSEKDIQFDPTTTIEFTGDTGPAIQYSYARVCSIFRNAAEQGLDLAADSNIHYELLNTPEEYTIIRKLCDFPKIIVSTCCNYNIGLLVNYLLSLTKSYASCYKIHSVLKAPTKELRDARLALAKATAQVLKNGMRLVGAGVPEQM